MVNTRATAAPILSPEDIRPVLLEPLAAQSIAGQVATVMYTDAPQVLVPGMTDLDVADWIPEGQEIPLGDAQFTQQTITPRRLVGGTLVTNELLEDSNPQAKTLLGQSLARDLSLKVDAAFFGAAGANTERPPGLTDLTGTTGITGTLHVDRFYAAETAAELAGGPLDTYVCSPATAAAIGKLVQAEQWNRDVANPARRQILGVPVLASTHVPDNKVWGIRRDTILVVVRLRAEVDASEGPRFLSFTTAIRSRVRIGWGFLRPANVIEIDLTT